MEENLVRLQCELELPYSPRALVSAPRTEALGKARQRAKHKHSPTISADHATSYDSCEDGFHCTKFQRGIQSDH